MNYRQARYNSVQSYRHEFHILTYAEEGFSPLNLNSKHLEITKDQLVTFSNEVNARNELGSLYPVAPISAVPRSLIREQQDAGALSASIKEFYKINMSTIGAKKVIIDFRTPNLDQFVLKAIKLSLESPDVAFINELIVINDNLSC